MQDLKKLYLEIYYYWNFFLNILDARNHVFFIFSLNHLVTQTNFCPYSWVQKLSHISVSHYYSRIEIFLQLQIYLMLNDSVTTASIIELPPPLSAFQQPQFSQKLLSFRSWPYTTTTCILVMS